MDGGSKQRLVTSRRVDASRGGRARCPGRDACGCELAEQSLTRPTKQTVAEKAGRAARGRGQTVRAEREGLGVPIRKGRSLTAGRCRAELYV